MRKEQVALDLKRIDHTPYALQPMLQIVALRLCQLREQPGNRARHFSLPAYQSLLPWRS